MDQRGESYRNLDGAPAGQRPKRVDEIQKVETGFDGSDAKLRLNAQELMELLCL